VQELMAPEAAEAIMKHLEILMAAFLTAITAE
jgi:hypothetical protein